MGSESYHLITGELPLIVSMPHNGFIFPSKVQNRYAPDSLQSKDSDWFVDKLYGFLNTQSITQIKPVYSRYLIDLNRSCQGECLYPGKDNTQLCPTTSFSGENIYRPGCNPDAEEIQRRIKRYWKPYHQALRHEIKRLLNRHSQVVLVDAHSIASKVPRFFKGQLPDFNFGTHSGHSCSDDLLHKIKQQLLLQGYSSVYNGRFKGGYITRNYGDPAGGLHAIQLELSQATYLHEKDLSWDQEKANRVIPYLQKFIHIINHWINTQ